MKNGMIALGLALVASGAHAATPVNFGSWTAEGPGSWALSSGNSVVTQMINSSSPTVFFSSGSALNKSYSGTMRVTSSSDDDFIGFVVGFNAGELSNGTADYLLIDWKKARSPVAGARATSASPSAMSPA